MNFIKKVKIYIVVLAVVLNILPVNMFGVNTLAVQAGEETATGLVVNGDFESDADGECQVQKGNTDHESIEGWSCWTNNDGSVINYKVVEEGRVDSSYAMKVSKDDSTTSNGGKVRGSITQVVSGLEIGKVYKVSAYVKIVNQTSSADTKVIVKKPKDGNVNNWTEAGRSSTITTSIAGTDWNVMTFEWLAEYDTYYLEVSMMNSTDGYFLIDDVTIEESTKTIPTLTLNPTSVENLEVGQTQTVSATVQDQENVLTAPITYTWESSDPDIATVDENGTVTAVSAGDANITVKAAAKNGSVSGTCIVKVVAGEEPETGLVKNGDFESDTNAEKLDHVNGTQPQIGNSQWSCWTAPGSTIDYQVVKEGRGDNNGYAMKISKDESIIDTEAAIRGSITQTVSGLEVNKKYKLSAYVKLEDQTNTSASAKVIVKDSNNAKIGESNTVKQNSAGGDWNVMTFEWVASGESCSLEISMNNSTDGYFLIDDVTIDEIEKNEPTLSVSPATVEIESGKSTTLIVTLADPDKYMAGEVTYEWSSSNTSVATVDQSGKVSGEANGEATITVTAKDTNNYSVSSNCNVTVTNDPVITNYILNGDFENDPDGLCEIQGSATDHISIEGWSCWTATGYVTRFEIAEEGRNDSHAMKISKSAEATSGSKVRGSITQSVDGLVIGDTYKFSLWVNMMEQSSVEGRAKVIVTNGETKEQVSPASLLSTQLKANGTWVELTYEWVAKAAKYSFEISVSNAPDGYFLFDDVSLVRVPAEPELVVTPNELELEVGAEETIVAEVVDPDEVLKEEVNIQWTSDNTTVATVDQNGKVTAVASGEASIMAVAEDGSFGAVCAVKVVEKEVPLTGIEISENTVEMFAGCQKALDVVFKPTNATNKSLNWSSSDNTVATVDENGLVIAWKIGNATITASTDDNKSASCTIQVKESTKLTTSKAEFTTNFGTSISKSLNSFVQIQEGGTISYNLLSVPENGLLELEEDGSFTYAPKGYGMQGHTDSFKVGVTVGDESAVLPVEITVKKLADSIATKLTEDTTLFITREELAQIKLEMQDENNVRYHSFKEYEPYLKKLLQIEPPTDQNPECAADCSNDTNYESEWQKPIGDRVAQLLWAYLLTDDEAYKEQCIEYTMASANYKHWGSTTQYLEADLAAGHMSFALGMVYNWLNDELNEEQKATIVKKLYYTCGQLYINTKDSKQYQQNHLWTRIGGFNSAAMSLYIHSDEVAKLLGDGTTAEEVRANCITWLEVVYDVMGKTFEWAPTDGASHEGASYYVYGLEYLLKTVIPLRNNLGIDMISGNDWLRNTSEYFANIMWPKNDLSHRENVIKYGDDKGDISRGPSHLFRALAGIYKDETAQWIAERFEVADANSDQYDYWIGILFADNSVEASFGTDKPNLYYADDLQIVSARTNRNGDESIVFMRSGLPLGKTGKDLLVQGSNEYHVDPDCNGIILFYNGEYLLRTDGYAKYKQTKNFSTLLVDGNGQIGGNEAEVGLKGDLFAELGLEPEIKKTEVGDGYSYFVGDATEAYNPELKLTKFERNVVLIEEENVMLVVDDIKTSQSKDLELRWFPSGKSVTESYGIYSVNSTNNITKFYPFSDEAETKWKEVDVYINGANEEEQAFVQYYSGLAWQNAVAFSWSASEENQAHVRYVESDANIHKFEVNGKIYTINVAENTVDVEAGKLDIPAEAWDSDSSLASVLMNGLAYEEFDSKVTEYTIERFWKTEELTFFALPNSPSATTETIWDGSCPGIVQIICTSGDGEHTTTYTFNLKNDNGMLTIVSATSEPNASGHPLIYTYDSYIEEIGASKTWSSKLLPVVTYDMGKLVDITKIDVAFNYSRDRSTFFDLLASEDGITWETVLVEDPETGGTPQTPAKEGRSSYVNVYEGTAVRARYVRFNLRSHTESGYDNKDAYNSIQEISIYGTIVNPEASATPTPGVNPEASATPTPGVNPEASATPTPGVNPEASATPTPGVNPEASATPTPDVKIEISDEDDGIADDLVDAASVTEASGPNTGDETHIILWQTLLIVAIGVFGYMILQLRKNKNNNG